MVKKLTVALVLGISAGAALGDSIDDAEAKRRGVPVIVIQLEKQIAAQKQKTTDVEKRIAEVRKKIAELESPAAALVKAPSNRDPQLPKPADGPRKASPVYDDMAARYMAGDWTKFTQDFSSKGPQLAALPAGNAADIAYMRATITECKPAWWARAKAGQAATIDATVFNHTIPVSFTPGTYSSSAITRNGKVLVLASWPVAAMDSAAPMPAATPPISLPAGEYTLGDLSDFEVWMAVATQLPIVEYGVAKIAELDKQEEKNIADHRDFCGAAAALYYGTPTSRYLGMAECAQAFDQGRKTAPLWKGRRQFAAFLLATLLSHPETYPSLKAEINGLPDELPKGIGPEEYLCQNFLLGKVMSSKLTFAEDCALRQAIWEFVMANTDWAGDQIKLPNGQALVIDLTKEPQAMKDRWAWYKRATEAKPATQPSATLPAQ